MLNLLIYYLNYLGGNIVIYFGLDNSEIKELYNMVIDEILRVNRLNNLNEIIIGDFDLDHIPIFNN